MAIHLYKTSTPSISLSWVYDQIPFRVHEKLVSFGHRPPPSMGDNEYFWDKVATIYKLPLS